MRGVEILGRSNRDANGPRRGLIGASDRHVPKNRVARLVINCIEKNELLEIAIGVEDLNAAVAAIGYVQISITIGPNVMRIPDFSRIFIRMCSTFAGPAPLLDPVAVLVK